MRSQDLLVRRRMLASVASLALGVLTWTAGLMAPAGAQMLAFPGAEGAGAFAVGGRNGDVYVVTNLNDSGAGSLRHGISNSPANGRTIVFGISGTIELQSDLQINRPYITIAGQTAPEGGITLKNRMVRVRNTHNVILQHITSRPGDLYTGSGYEPDAIWVSGSNNVILDHVSASWATDEVLSVTHGSTNVTVQWSLMTEALHDSNHSSGNHGYGSIFHGGESTLHHNLYANNRSRNPATGNWDKNSPITPAHVDIVNNVIFNPGDRYSYSGGQDQYHVNYVGNFGIEGPNTTRKNELFHPDHINTFVYFAENYYDDNPNGILQPKPAPQSMLTGTYTPLASPANTTNPPNINDAPTAYMQILSYAGSAKWRDPIDKRVLNGVINQTGDHIDSQTEVGGWHTFTPVTHQLGADGLPAWWKQAHGFDPNDQTVGLQFTPSGYTYLEKYLHYLNAPFMPPQQTTPIAISTAFGKGADAQISEINGSAHGSGTSDRLNARWTGPSGSNNEVILLRFDLSKIQIGSVANATLDLTAFRNMANDTLRVYGLEHDVSNQNWDEASISFDNAPGVAFDGNSGTRSLKTEDLLLLGEFSTGGALEGDIVSFANPDLSAFLNMLMYRNGGGDTVTLLLERQNNSAGQTRFASKEATQLQSGGSPVDAGTYAPRLNLDAVLNIPGDFDQNLNVDGEDLLFWERGFGIVSDARKLQGDADGDGNVDGHDFLAWQRQFGAAHGNLAETSQSIPEPGSGVLTGIGIIILTMRMRFL